MSPPPSLCVGCCTDLVSEIAGNASWVISFGLLGLTLAALWGVCLVCICITNKVGLVEQQPKEPVVMATAIVSPTIV